MSKALSPGMCNVPVNMTEQERGILGKLAFERDRSLGHFVRDLILSALSKEAPAKAAAIMEARRSHRADALRRLGSAALLGLVVVNTVQAWTGHSDADAMRRTSARVRVVRAGKELEAA